MQKKKTLKLKCTRKNVRAFLHHDIKHVEFPGIGTGS